MVESVSKLVLSRLVMLWLVLSVVIGGGVFYFEITKVDDSVLALVLDEVEAIDQNLIDGMLNTDDDGILDKLQTLTNELTEQQFAIADIYDNRYSHIAAAVRFDSELVGEILEEKHHQFSLDNSFYHEKFYIQQELYVQVLVPLLASTGGTAGYFEGVYHVEKETVEAIESQVYNVLFVVLVVILAAFIVFYPLLLYLNRQIITFSKNLFQANIELMEVMGSAVAKRDSTTDIHNYRVTLYAIRLGEALGLNSEALSNLIAGAFLHDVGKIGIDDDVLNKNDRLTEEEIFHMRQHVLIGVDIVAKAHWLHGAREVIEFHHEKFDGTGYMKGLKGEVIPLNARIFAIVDVFDALISERPYKNAIAFNEVIAIMRKESGKHFDPKLLAKFLDIAEDLHRNIGKASYHSLVKRLSNSVRKHFFRARLI